MKQKLSKKAAAAKRVRDKKYAMTARRRSMKQRTNDSEEHMRRSMVKVHSKAKTTTTKEKSLYLLNQTGETVAKVLKKNNST